MNKIDNILLEQLHYCYTIKKGDIDSSKGKRSRFSSGLIIDTIKETFNGSGITSVYKSFITYDIQSEKEVWISPLHIALSNTRSVGIILQYMAKIESAQWGIIKDLIHEIVDNPHFGTYLQNITFQTQRMSNKVTLQVGQMETDEIAKIVLRPFAHVDNRFYIEDMDENTENMNFKNYPVKVLAIKINWILSEHGEAYLTSIDNSENLDLYDNETNQTIIEYLYIQHQSFIMRYQISLLFCQIIAFCIGIFEKEFIADVYPIHARQRRFWVSVLNLIMCIGGDFWFLAQFWYNGWKSLQSRSNIFQLSYVLLNGYISIVNITFWYNDPVNNQSQVPILRVCEAFTSLILFFLTLLGAQIFDEFAPLVNSVFQILIHIQSFIYILVVSVVGLSIPFYLLGNNQVQFDELSDSELGNISYNTWYGTLIYTYHLALGDFNYDIFGYGNRSQYYILWVLFIVSTFLLLVHFLNMLIAIMGEVILNDDDLKRKIQLKTKLGFILETWWGNPLKNEKQRAMYIVAAYLKSEEDKELGDINIVKSSVDRQSKEVRSRFDQIEQKLIDMRSTVDVINKNITQEVLKSPMRKAGQIKQQK